MKIFSFLSLFMCCFPALVLAQEVPEEQTPSRRSAWAPATEKQAPVPSNLHESRTRIPAAGKNDMQQALEIPTYFPYQDGNVSGFNLVSLDNGDILVIMRERYANFTGGGGNLSYVRSTDGGITWEPPGVIAEREPRPPFFDMSFKTATGRVLVSWQDTDSSKVMMTYSDDDGQSWAEPLVVVPPKADFPRGLVDHEIYRISQTADSTLWFFYSRYKVAVEDPNRENRDVLYRMSTDDGNSWGEEMPFATTMAWEMPPFLYSESDSSLAAISVVYEEDLTALFNQGPKKIAKQTSVDGGVTWSAPQTIFEEPAPGYELDDTIYLLGEQDSDLLWLVFGGSRDSLGYRNSDIFYSRSFDRGASWSSPAHFTTYIGGDRLQTADLVGEYPMIGFYSTRQQNGILGYNFYYGLLGTTTDNAPPDIRERPYVLAENGSHYYSFNLNPSYVRQEQSIPVQGFARDESGVASMDLFYTVLGKETEGPFSLANDGMSNDREAGDEYWGGIEIGPFNPGDKIRLGFTATDIDNQTATLKPSFSYDPTWLGLDVEVVPFHDAGKITLPIRDDGSLGEISDSTNLAWPEEGAHPYMVFGGMVAGVRVDGVSQRALPLQEWTRKPASESTISQEVSDQDIRISYYDAYNYADSTVRPVGLDVTQESYQWSDPEMDDFIVFKYHLENTGGYNLEDLVVALFFELDIPNSYSNPSWANDKGAYDEDRNLLYMFDGEGDSDTHIGLKLLGVNEAPQAAILLSSGDQERVLFSNLHTTLLAGTPEIPEETGNYSVLLGAGPYNLPEKGDTLSVTFGLVFGESLEAMQANADVMTSMFAVSGVASESSDLSDLPQKIELAQNYPNPFSQTTTIKYALPEPTEVRIQVFDMLGRLVATLVDASKPQGTHAVDLDASHLASGFYFYTFSAGSHLETRKLMVLK